MLREWLWWPSVKSHAWACGIAFIAVTFLGIVEIPRFPAFKELTTVQASPTEFFVLSAVIAAANACFLFLHARGDYLTARSGLCPMTLSFLFLSLAFPLAWGLFHVLLKNSPFPDIRILASGVAHLFKAAMLSEASTFEWTRVARAIFVGQGGLAMVLLFSGLWKAPPQETVDLSGAWDRSRPLVRRVFRRGPLLDVTEHERLKALLALLAEGAKKLDTRAFLRADLALANALARNAQTVLVTVDRPFGALDNLRTSANKNQLAAVSFVLGERDL